MITTAKRRIITPSEPIDNSLVLHYDTANNNSYPDTGAILTDLSGNNHNATMSGMSYVSEYGGGVRSNGSGHQYYIKVGSNAAYNSLTRLTVEAWVKRGNRTGSVDYQFIFSNARNCCGSYKGYNLWMTSRLVFGLWNGSEVRAESPSGLIQKGNIYHTAGTYDGSKMKMYLDGILVAEKDYIGGIGTPATGALHIGQLSIGGYTYFAHTGTYYQTRIYNRALTDSEVFGNFNATKSIFGK